MFHRMIGAAAVCVAMLLCGCDTPAVHSVWSKDKDLTDPALAGTWKSTEAENKNTYEITRVGEGYRMVAKSNDPEKPESWTFDLRLAQLGEERYADFQALESERKKLDDQWGPFFMPTHLFARYAVEGDKLSVWLPNREKIEKALNVGAFQLAHTKVSDNLLLITAETADLQSFLQAHAKNKELFDMQEMRRERP